MCISSRTARRDIFNHICEPLGYNSFMYKMSKILQNKRVSKKSPRQNEWLIKEPKIDPNWQKNNKHKQQIQTEQKRGGQNFL